MNKKNLKAKSPSRLDSWSKYLKTNAVSLYLREIDRIPLLSRNEEIELSKLVAAGDSDAKEKLIISNLRFVISIAKKYQGFGIPLSDLISEGNIGLMAAVDKFDYKKGFHFISYAIWWIRQSIMKALSEKSRLVRLPMNRSNELMHIWKYIEEYSKINGKRPTDDLIAEYLSMNKSDIKKVLEISQAHSSLEDLFSEDESGSAEEVFEDMESENRPDDMAITSSLKEMVKNVLNKLPDREKRIIEYRFGLNGEEPQSLSSIGDKLHLTKERIRQIEKAAINQIRNYTECPHLYAFLS
jgi:RNA polymerase primary sigma factor